MTCHMLRSALIAGPQGKWILCARTSSESLGDFAWVWRLVRGIIKGSNHRQNELCALFSQTNQWADFERDVQETEECLCESAGSVPGVWWWCLFFFCLFFGNDWYQRKPGDVALTFGKVILEIVRFACARRRRTLSPLTPLGPGTPDSPLNPWSSAIKSLAQS